MSYQSIRGRAFGYDSVAPIAYVNGVPLYGADYPTRGQLLFVDSNVAGSDGHSPATALATIDAAINKCVASRGDRILVMPFHAETIAAAAAIACDIAGIEIIGLGRGNARPQITWATDAATTIAITAANVAIENLICIGNISNVVAGITTTKKSTRLRGLDFRNAGTNLDFLTPIKALGTTTADNDDLSVRDCRWNTLDADDLEFIEINGTLSRFECMNNVVNNTGSTAGPLILVATTKLLLQAEIGYNRLVNANTANELFISNDGTTNTGVIHNNFVGHADVTGTHDPGWDGGGFRLWNNASASVDNLQGAPIPAIDVNL